MTGHGQHAAIGLKKSQKKNKLTDRFRPADHRPPTNKMLSTSGLSFYRVVVVLVLQLLAIYSSSTASSATESRSDTLVQKENPAAQLALQRATQAPLDGAAQPPTLADGNPFCFSVDYLEAGFSPERCCDEATPDPYCKGGADRAPAHSRAQMDSCAHEKRFFFLILAMGSSFRPA